MWEYIAKRSAGTIVGDYTGWSFVSVGAEGVLASHRTLLKVFFGMFIRGIFDTNGIFLFPLILLLLQLLLVQVHRVS